jgi:hypothetical protein
MKRSPDQDFIEEPPVRIELTTYSLRVLGLGRLQTFQTSLTLRIMLLMPGSSSWGDAGGTRAGPI